MLIHHALRYASHGLRVLALSPLSKIPPAGSHGVSDASTDTEQIMALFRRAGPGAGIGLVPGPRWWVLDVDTEAPRAHPDGWTGIEAIEALRDAGLVLPSTRTASTPRGGLHLWWLVGPGQECPRPRSAGTLVLGRWAGLDVRSVGSYVVAPPTSVRVADGPGAGEVRSYAWVAGMTAVVAPDWLMDLVAPSTTPSTAPVQAPPLRAPHGGEEAYARAVLHTAMEACASPATGRHRRWYAHARLVGGYVGSGLLSRSEAEQALVSAGLRSLAHGEHRGREVRRTVAQGIEAGMTLPCRPPRDMGR